MRSMFSNRYNNKRDEFYDRYEAVRALHPSLPLYERPVEPTSPMNFGNSAGGARPKSYLHQKRQTSEQFHNDQWLTSDQLPIAVRRSLEERNGQVLMPKYDPSAAKHEFSHSTRFRQRGRAPSAATTARIASEFALQVGGVPTVETSQRDCENLDPDLKIVKVEQAETSQMEDFENQDPKIKIVKVEQAETSQKEHFENLDPELKIVKVEQAVASQKEECESQDSEKILKEKPTTSHNQVAKSKTSPKPKRAREVRRPRHMDEFWDFNVEDEGNVPTSGRRVSSPSFICPEASCQINFNMLRSLTLHQRETGHHNWSHKCDKCGQVFRTEGFKRMHTPNACESNLKKQNPKRGKKPE